MCLSLLYLVKSLTYFKLIVANDSAFLCCVTVMLVTCIVSLCCILETHSKCLSQTQLLAHVHWVNEQSCVVR